MVVLLIDRGVGVVCVWVVLVRVSMVLCGVLGSTLLWSWCSLLLLVMSVFGSVLCWVLSTVLGTVLGTVLCIVLSSPSVLVILADVQGLCAVLVAVNPALPLAVALTAALALALLLAVKALLLGGSALLPRLCRFLLYWPSSPPPAPLLCL